MNFLQKDSRKARVSGDDAVVVVLAVAAFITTISLVAFKTPAEVYTSVGLLFNTFFGFLKIYQMAKERLHTDNRKQAPESTKAEDKA